MKKLFGLCFTVVLISMIVASCGKERQDDPRAVVESFSNAYFNWRFKEAEAYVTKESTKWLVFAASQVDTEDIDSLRAIEYAATAEVGDIDDIDDSTALVTVVVKDFLPIDSIGKHPCIQETGSFQIPVSFDGKNWKVKLTCLP